MNPLNSQDESSQPDQPAVHTPIIIQPPQPVESVEPVNPAPIAPAQPTISMPPQPEALQPPLPAQPVAAQPQAPVISMSAEEPVAPVFSGVITPTGAPAAPAPDTSAPAAFAVVPPTEVPTSFNSSPKPKRRLLKPILLAALAVVVLGGGTAAAYVGVVLPNKPENVLLAALANSVQQDQISYKGTIEGGPATGSGLSYKVDLAGAANTSQKALQTTVNVTVSGATISFEARLVDGNAYLKIGDLDTITSLIGGYSPELSAMAKAVSSELADQWIEIDSTLIKTAGGDCVLSADWSITNDDLKLLHDQYSKNPFNTIVSHSSDTVGGKKVEKFVLSIDDDKAAAYGKTLNDLSIAKKLKSCDSKSTTTAVNNISGDHDKTPLTVWVDKSTKQIVQVASESTAQDAQKDNIKAKGTIGLSYGKVSITKPSSSKPALQVLGELETKLGGSGLDLSSLLSSGLSGSSTFDTNTAPASLLN